MQLSVNAKYDFVANQSLKTLQIFTGQCINCPTKNKMLQSVFLIFLL